MSVLCVCACILQLLCLCVYVCCGSFPLEATFSCVDDATAIHVLRPGTSFCAAASWTCLATSWQVLSMPTLVKLPSSWTLTHARSNWTLSLAYSGLCLLHIVYSSCMTMAMHLAPPPFFWPCCLLTARSGLDDYSTAKTLLSTLSGSTL